VLTTHLLKKHTLRITHKLRCFLWRQNNPEVNYSPTRISGGGVFLQKVSRSRKMGLYSQKYNKLVIIDFHYVIMMMFITTTTTIIIIIIIIVLSPLTHFSFHIHSSSLQSQSTLYNH